MKRLKLIIVAGLVLLLLCACGSKKQVSGRVLAFENGILTLVDETGAELEMPTGFDDFSAKADRNYFDCTETAANNAQLLEILMEKHGFAGYAGEWWHYSDTTSYQVEDVFEP